MYPAQKLGGIAVRQSRTVTGPSPKATPAAAKKVCNEQTCVGITQYSLPPQDGSSITKRVNIRSSRKSTASKRQLIKKATAKATSVKKTPAAKATTVTPLIVSAQVRHPFFSKSILYNSGQEIMTAPTTTNKRKAAATRREAAANKRVAESMVEVCHPHHRYSTMM